MSTAEVHAPPLLQRAAARTAARAASAGAVPGAVAAGGARRPRRPGRVEQLLVAVGTAPALRCWSGRWWPRP